MKAFFSQHFVAQRDEFESTKESLMFWLTKMELQLTNVEHLSEGDAHHKLNKLKVSILHFTKLIIQLSSKNDLH